MLITVAELLSVAERQDIVNYLAAFPKSGDLIKGTGGVRRLRWARGGRGKSGGVRVITTFTRMPLYLLTVFSKSERADLTQAERNDLGRLVEILVDSAFGE